MAISKPGGKITGLRTVGIPVTDQDKALDFYTGKLGLEKRMDVTMGGGGPRWIEVAPLSGETTIALVAASATVPAAVETGVRLTSADADATHDDLVAGGVDTDEVLRWPGVPPMFKFRDPDGNALEIVQQP